VDHSPPSIAEGKNVWSYTSTLVHLHGMVLGIEKHRGNFTFTFLRDLHECASHIMFCFQRV
jgi:hypothetical protein